MTLGFYEDSKSNNFTLVRIIAALSVLFCHSFAITGYKTDPLTWIIQKLHFSESSGKLAVCIFFPSVAF